MERRLLRLFVVGLTLLLLTASLASAAPGAPSLRWVTTSATTAELRADGLTGGGTAGNGAISWDLYFRFPASVSSPYPAVSVVPGPAWTGMSPCTFATNVSLNQPSAPGATGQRGVLINGFCTAGVPSNPVTGSDVLVATVTFASCPSGTAGFVMDLDSGDDVFGSSVAALVDRGNDAYSLTDADTTDGTSMCAVPIGGSPPILVGVTSRKGHGAAGTFDLALSPTPLTPTTEPRSAGSGGTHAAVFTFDKTVASGTAAITEGAAVAGTPTFNGNEMTVPVTGVADAQYVTLALTNVTAADGGTGGSGSVRIGFLAGDVNQNRAVTLSDLLGVNAVLTQPISAANFLRDVNVSGTLTLSDVLFVNSRLTQSLPAP